MNELAMTARVVGGPVMPQRYREIRAFTDYLAAYLSDEDQCVQSMPDASPAKWHKAHTTWFFEQFVLCPFLPDYRVFDSDFAYLFNSYYELMGPRHPRPNRGLLTRPSGERVRAYRRHVDTAMMQLFELMPNPAAGLIELGLQHEQQHQELLLTDMLHAFAQILLRRPCCRIGRNRQACQAPHASSIVMADWYESVMTAPASVLTTRRPPILHICHPIRSPRAWCATVTGWHSLMTAVTARQPCGCRTVGRAARMAIGRHRWYWQEMDGVWWQMGLRGRVPLDPDAPVRHISWYEADAYARWADARLPTEAELEAVSECPDIGELTGHVWQWTSSAYGPYPGYRPAAGAVGEYNGKFMINQMVLRGASLATPANHARRSYRNFFHPDKRWQFTGVRLARDL